MSLLSRFMQNIRDIFVVPDASVELDGEKIDIGQHELPLIGVFFPTEDGTAQLQDYFDLYEEDSAAVGRLLAKNPNHKNLQVSGLDVLNRKLDAGIYEMVGTDSERSVVFTGSCGYATSIPDLRSFPEVLLAIAVLPKMRCANSISWTCLLEGIGPFVISAENHPLLSLAECGLTLRRENSFSFKWSNSIPNVVQLTQADIPKEAEAAYIAALQDSATADVAFLRLYRVLEILFAGTYQHEIANAHLSRVIALIQLFQSRSELDILRKLVDKSTVDFTRFSISDFNILFEQHKPQGNYAKISAWLSDEHSSPPRETRALIIYYVRCALVHSKLTDKEPFLIGPFSPGQEDALQHLVEDTRDLVSALLF